MAFTLALFFACITFVSLYFLLIQAIDKRISSRKVIESAEEGLAEVLVSMSETVEQNIALFEEKSKELRSMIDLADRKIKLLEKEQEKFERGKDTYQELVKRKPLVNSVIELKKEEAPPAPVGSSTHGRQGGLGQIKTPPSQYNGPHPVPAPVAAAERRKEISGYVLQLFREGKTAQEIAGQMNIALAEAELIISMHINQMKPR